MISKAKAQKRHAKRRAQQRFDLDLTDDDIKALVRQIQSGRALFLVKQSLRVGVFQVSIRDLKLVAVYDKERKTIVTVMPVEWWQIRRREDERRP